MTVKRVKGFFGRGTEGRRVKEGLGTLSREGRKGPDPFQEYLCVWISFQKQPFLEPGAL
jgi:hypothetical protein